MTTPRKKPLRLLWRLAQLSGAGGQTTSELVQQSYDRISPGYDNTWTHHMRDCTDRLLNSLVIEPASRCLDLTCGTGYATGRLAQSTDQPVTGVDRSPGMIAQAARLHPACRFIQSDILDYLGQIPDSSFDIVTCCWGLGYSRPLAVLRQIRRILKKGGQAAIIDNSLFSLREVLYASLLTFMEYPDQLEHLMRFRFLAGPRQLKLWLRLAGLEPIHTWKGRRVFPVASGTEAVERLRATGAAAGFEYAARPETSDQIFRRFAGVFEQTQRKAGQLAIIHRYLAGIAIR